MTPEQTLDWLAEQHKSQCNEDRPVQEWIRSMKSMLPTPVQEPVALETVYETIIHWDEGGGKRSRRELARRIAAIYTTLPAAQPEPVPVKTFHGGKPWPLHPAPVQEPVAVVSGYYGGQCVVLPTNPARLFNSGTAFYTTTPAAQRQWVGLTDEEIDKLFDDGPYVPAMLLRDVARAIEAKLKEKNA